MQSLEQVGSWHNRRDRPLCELEGFRNAQWVQVDSAFGPPSDELLIGELDGQRLVFLPRHGRGHRLSPTHVNYRANIEAMKRVGVTRIISFSAVGSLTEHLRPGDFVIVDQYIDRTFAREKSFFGAGMAAHVSMADPVCRQLGDVLELAAGRCDMSVTRGGTYLVMEGPQFSTRAESELYRTWGCDVIGMTNMPEAKLAREAEICYATVAMVTDYDCWHPEHEDVSAKNVLEVLHDNAGLARSLGECRICGGRRTSPRMSGRLPPGPRTRHRDSARRPRSRSRKPALRRSGESTWQRRLGICLTVSNLSQQIKQVAKIPVTTR